MTQSFKFRFSRVLAALRPSEGLGRRILERYQAVRAKEMMEARVDAVFVSLYEDPEFVTLTAGADGMQAMPRR